MHNAEFRMQLPKIPFSFRLKNHPVACVSFWFAFAVPWIEPRARHMLGKLSATALQPSPFHLLKDRVPYIAPADPEVVIFLTQSCK